MVTTSTQATTVMYFQLSINWRRAEVYLGLLITGLISPIQTRAQTLDSAQSFVTELYKPYTTGIVPDRDKQASQIYAPHLLTLMRKDGDVTPAGDVPYLDGDPLCDCQDAKSLKVGRIVVSRTSPTRARATTVLSFPSRRQRLTIELVAVGRRWRVADIATSEQASLVAALQDDLRQQIRGADHLHR